MAIKYLLTGASGNLGGNVVRELLDRSTDIRALVIPGDRTAAHLPENIEKYEGDVLDIDALRRFFTVPDGTELVVIHMAAIVTTYPEFVQKVYDVNVGGTRNILQLCVEHKVKKLVYVSSSSAIPELPKGQTIKEVSSFDPDKVIGFYAKTKAEASQLVLDAVREHGLNASIVFPTAICGPEDYAKGHLTQLLIDSCNGKMPAGIKGGIDAVDVRDLAQGIVLCAQKGRPGEGYILGNQYVSLREIFHEVHVQTGAKEVKLMLPIWLAKAAVPFSELYYKARKRLPMFTKFALYNLIRNNNYSSEKAKRELGYTVRPFQDTIADTLRWLKRDGLIKQPQRRK
jgi:dihydroflavonol-4-reductase